MSHAPQIRLGTLACLLLTCAVAPPLVRGAESGTISDGGGCNGKREVQFAADSEGGSTTMEESSTGMSEPTMTTGSGSCGDGMVDAGEGCDDGNGKEEDACPSGGVGQCKAEAECGDGFVWVGMEDCDDGNVEGGDGCESDCTVTLAVCGNGVKEGGEGCDDGNVEEGDACPSGGEGQCKAVAGCGDGFVWAGMEECDDGYGVEEDACPSGGAGQCKAGAVCGDGFVWTGMEGCDDGNGEELDGCNGVCAAPRWVFITSTLSVGNLGGVAGADAYCQGLAVAAELSGTYKAWLTGADAASAPAQRFGSAGFEGWYLLPTEPPTAVARGWTDLTSPNEDVPANYLQGAIHADEKGGDVGETIAWTNTKTDGTQQSPDKHCSGWSTSANAENGTAGLAKAGIVTATWTNNLDFSCIVGARLYCFQTE